jgi:hypothetical protein
MRCMHVVTVRRTTALVGYLVDFDAFCCVLCFVELRLELYNMYVDMSGRGS